MAITEILDVVLTYAVKSLLENLSRHNSWPDKVKGGEKTEMQQSDL